MTTIALKATPFFEVPLKQYLRFILALILGLTCSAHAGVLLDDTWADGTRNNQNLPVESAWYASTGASLTAAANSMSLAVGSGAIMAVTYFTTNVAGPVQLGVGDTLKATFTLTFTGVGVPNGSQGFRIGIFDFADSTLSPKRVSADFSGNNSQGSGVQGYSLFQNMGTAFTNTAPMEIRRRTGLTDTGLLGTSSDWTPLVSGPSSSNSFPGFNSGTQYIFQMTLERRGSNALAITTTWLNPAVGGILEAGVVDTGATN